MMTIEELSEEDQQLKSELDMLVERILVCCCHRHTPCVRESPQLALTFAQESDSSLYKPALDQIKEFIKTSTSSMTAVPKPLKFLRPHYESLEKQYASWPEGENKVWKLYTGSGYCADRSSNHLPICSQSSE